MLALFPYPLIPSPLLLNRKLASHTIDKVFQFYVIRDFESDQDRIFLAISIQHQADKR